MSSRAAWAFRGEAILALAQLRHELARWELSENESEGRLYYYSYYKPREDKDKA